MSREACCAALFALLQGLVTDGTVKLADRKVRLIDDLSGAEFPALFMGGGNGKQSKIQGLPPERVIGATVYLYAANPDKHTTADTVLNGLIDKVDALLDPGWQGVQTLGALVADCWIDGAVEVFSGALGERAAAIVPVKILMP